MSPIALSQLHGLEGLGLLSILLIFFVMEFSDKYFLNILVTGVLQDDELMGDNPVSYFLLLGRIKLIGV